MKEEKSKLVVLIEKFFEEAKPLFKEQGSRGLFVMGIDDTVGENQVALTGMMLGKKSTLVTGLAKMMDKAEDIREVLQDSVGFYKFKTSPLGGLVNTLKDLIDDIEEMKEASEEAEEEVPIEETNK